MPCCPVFIGPLPPAFFANSSRAFLSRIQCQHCGASVADVVPVQWDHGDVRTGLLLGLEGNVVLVEFLVLLLLGLLVMDGVGARCGSCGQLIEVWRWGSRTRRYLPP